MALRASGALLEMTNLAGRTLRRIAGEDRGAEIAEAAAVLPLMFMVLLGIFWFGQAFSIYGTITRAAQEGARAGATPQCATCPPATNSAAQNAYQSALAALVAANLNPLNAQYPSPVPALNACTTGTGTVSCDASTSTNVCIQTGIQLSNPSIGGTGMCGISVSFRYPFQFWLPFTSLNQQQIWITASAQERIETQ